MLILPPLPRHSAKALVLVALLAGCAASVVPPSWFGAIDPTAPYPSLIPLDPLLAQAAVLDSGAQPGAELPGADLPGRIAALNARAAALRRPIIDPTTRARMEAGVASPALQ